MHPEVSRARATLASISRCVKNGERSPADLLVAKDRLEQAKVSAVIDKLIAEAPPLSDEQRTRLAELLRPVRHSPSRCEAEAELDGGA